MIEAFQNLFTPPRHMILLVLAAWLGLTLAERRSQRHGISSEDLNNITFYALLAFVIGGRFSYILQNIPAFSKSPLSIFSINPNLFDTFGAIAAAGIVTFAYGQRKQLNIWNILDALTPFFAIIAIGLGLSHLAAKTAFGTPTTLPWGIDMWNEIRHPVQIYEILASSLILVLVWRFKPGPRPGINFLIFAVLTAFSSLVMQSFRAEYEVVFNSIRQEQVITWLILFACFILIETRLRNPDIIKKENKTG